MGNYGTADKQMSSLELDIWHLLTALVMGDSNITPMGGGGRMVQFSLAASIVHVTIVGPSTPKYDKATKCLRKIDIVATIEIEK